MSILTHSIAMIALAGCLVFAEGHQAQAQSPPPADVIEAKRHGCLTPSVCILTLEDVRHLPDRGGALGFKLVEGKPTFEIVDGKRKYQPFVMFAIFDVAKQAHPSLKEGVSLVTISRYAFDGARSAERYVRSLPPGSTVSVNLAFADASGMATRSERIVLPVIAESSLKFQTRFPVFVSQEQAQKINR